MFNTIGNTWDLMAASWRVLGKHKSLMLFPVMSGAGVLVLALLSAGVVFGIGAGNASRELNVFFGFVVYLVAAFTVIFFNAGLIAPRTRRWRGGRPLSAPASTRRMSAWIPSSAGRSSRRQLG